MVINISKMINIFLLISLVAFKEIYAEEVLQFSDLSEIGEYSIENVYLKHTSEAWCPQNCSKEGEIYEDWNLSYYCKCETVDNKLTVKMHNCIKSEIYNETVQACYELSGGGIPICVFREKQCPSNEIGIIKHPNANIFRNYVICLPDKTIVAECDPLSYYNETEKQCKQQEKKTTVLLHSDCPQIPPIECERPEVIRAQEYFERHNRPPVISEYCQNCYYFCNDWSLDEFHLTVQCIPEFPAIAGHIPPPHETEIDDVETTFTKYSSSKAPIALTAATTLPTMLFKSTDSITKLIQPEKSTILSQNKEPTPISTFESITSKVHVSTLPYSKEAHSTTEKPTASEIPVSFLQPEQVFASSSTETILPENMVMGNVGSKTSETVIPEAGGVFTEVSTSPSMQSKPMESTSRTEISKMFPQLATTAATYEEIANTVNAHSTSKISTTTETSRIPQPEMVDKTESTNVSTPYEISDFKKCEKEGFFRYKNSCTLHYECYYEQNNTELTVSRLRKCAQCHKFNAKLMRCDLAENVPECTFRQPNDNNSRKTCTGPGIYPVPEDIKKYYECIIDEFNNGEYLLTEKLCPNGKIFDEVKGSCEHIECENNKCFKSHLAEECGDNNMVYNKYDCRKFFQCENGNGIELVCPKNFIFNGNNCQSLNSTSFCDWDELSRYLNRDE